MDDDLTPMGELRRRLPLRRKVKQLERPWQHADTGAQVVVSQGPVWASSQQGGQDGQPPGVRVKCGIRVASRSRSSGGRMRTSASASSGIFNRGMMAPFTRRRPSSGPSPSSSSLRRPRTWSNQSSYSSPAQPTWDGSDPVRWDGTVGSLGCGPEQGQVDVVRGCGYRLGLAGGKDAGHKGIIGKKQPLQTSATPSSNVRSSPLLAASSTATMDAAAQVDSEDVGGNAKADELVSMFSGKSNGNDVEDDEDSYNNKSNLSLGSIDLYSSAGAGGGAPTPAAAAAASKRPNSASVLFARNASVHQLPLKGDKVVRPQSVGSIRQGRNLDPPLVFVKSQPSERSCTPSSGRPGPEKGAIATTSCENDADAGSSIECRGSVSVVLPILEEGNDARDGRFSPGSTSEVSIRGELKAGKGVPCGTENLTVDIGDAVFMGKESKEAFSTAENAHTLERITRSRYEAQQRVADDRDNRAQNALPGTRAPHISALGYFVENPKLNVTPSAGAALHGRALVGNHCSRPSSSKRPLPPPPAITPGEQPYGASHPLSPTSMGSPPRRHRNSNWGEEGVPLAVEEVEKSRQTIPFIVSGTMLGWKLSTRERKKSLEDSLKTCDYSEHHLIPVYGFLRKYDRNNNINNENEAGGEGSGGGVTSMEERRGELRRLEARALAAERMSMERRARAEGGAEGAAFARAMCRRARARAEWIQKVGDVHDVRKENVCRGSSPEIISAYRKRVMDRLHGERLRQRTTRGLPSRRPPSISAVTSRADLPMSARKSSTEERACRDKDDGAVCSVVNNGWVGGGRDGMMQDELGSEPYLMLVRTKNNLRGREGEAARGGRGLGVAAVSPSVPFCSGCLGDCQGACSPASGRSIPAGVGDTAMDVKAEGWGSGRWKGPILKSSHHEQRRTKGRKVQQQTNTAMLPGGAGGGSGLSAATGGLRGWW